MVSGRVETDGHGVREEEAEVVLGRVETDGHGVGIAMVRWAENKQEKGKLSQQLQRTGQPVLRLQNAVGRYSS